jgi:hypothetical protein
MRLAAFLSLSLAIVPTLARAADATFLFDVLRTPHYRGAWNKLLKDVQPTPDWLREFDHNFDGAAGQMVAVTIDGKPYELSYVCKPTECDTRKFEVLFDADGMRAYGALGGKGNDPAFYGAPTPAMQEAMTKAVKE